MDDNLYPRSGAYRPLEPTNQILEKQKIEAQVVKALPLIQELLTRFEEKVAFFKSIDSVPEDVLTIPDEFMHIVAANKLVAGMLEAELNYMRELVEEHSK